MTVGQIASGSDTHPTRRRPDRSLAPRSCPVCATEFQPYRDFQRACSRSCRDRMGPANVGPNAKPRRFVCTICGKESERISTSGAGLFRYCSECKPEAERRGEHRKNAGRRIENDPHRRERNREQSLAQLYGLTLDQHSAMLESQRGCCAICGNPPDPNGVRAASRLHVDHDHDSGQIRDLLCIRCNQGLGYFGDDAQRLRTAADYLERHQGEAMRVRMRISISGAMDGQPWPPAGGECDVPDAAAVDLINAGYAEPVGAPAPETATPPAPVIAAPAPPEVTEVPKPEKAA